MKKIAVILAGCGSKDGSEIHEATLALYSLSYQGLQYTIFAPDMVQQSVVNHINGTQMQEERNTLVESSRIARGNIQPLSALVVDAFDALVLPGGFGAAKNLFTFAFDGASFSVLPDAEQIIRAFHTQKKPICAMCIAPLMIAKLLGSYGVKVTLGPKPSQAARCAEDFGADVVVVAPDEVCIDVHNKLITTPSYMYDTATIVHIGAGAATMTTALVEMMKQEK